MKKRLERESWLYRASGAFVPAAALGIPAAGAAALLLLPDVLRLIYTQTNFILPAIEIAILTFVLAIFLATLVVLRVCLRIRPASSLFMETCWAFLRSKIGIRQ